MFYREPAEVYSKNFNISPLTGSEVMMRKNLSFKYYKGWI